MMREELGAKQFRSFGLIIGGIFAFISLWPTLFRGDNLHLWVLILAGLLIVQALLWPMGLRPIYRVWMAIGYALGWANTRIILSIGFYGMFTPMGYVMRLLGKDPMRRGFDPNTSTYRVLPSPQSGSHMKMQF